MTEDDLKLAIPRRLDDPPKFLLWDFDVVLVFLIFAGLGIVVNFPFVLGGLGLAAAYGLNKARAGRSRGYLLHLLYWHLPLRFGFRRTPPSAVRHFIG